MLGYFEIAATEFEWREAAFFDRREPAIGIRTFCFSLFSDAGVGR